MIKSNYIYKSSSQGFLISNNSKSRDNMESDKPKKKKKYVLANNNQKKPLPQTTQNPVPQEKIEGKALERSRFDYTFEEIVNHLLARLLPNDSYTIKLSERLIFGEQNKLDDFVIKLDNNIKYTVGVTLQLEEEVTKEDIDYKMDEKYRGKTFNSKLIEMSVKSFFEGSKYERDYANFLNQFKDKEKQRIYVRINRCYLQQFLDLVKEDAHLLKNEEEEQKQAEPPKRRGNRTVFKQQIASIQIQEDAVNLQDVIKFFNKSDKCNYEDLEVSKVRNSQGSIVGIKFVLKSYSEEKDLKLEAFNYYFRHQNIVMLPLKDSKHKDQICQQYGNIDESHIKTKIIKGYKSSKWEEKSLLYKVRTKTISSKKTNYTNEYFQAIHIKGLFPAVQDLIEDLQSKINEVPLDDIREELIIQFSENVKDYIRNSKDVETFIENFINEYMKQFDSVCLIEKIKFPVRGVKLSLIVHNSAQDQFLHVKKNIEKTMPSYISQQTLLTDFTIDQQFLNKLQEENILVVDHSEKKFVYLTSSDEVSKCNEKVQKIFREFESVGEKSIEVVGLTKKLKYLELIQSYKQQKEEYKQILVAQPDSEDKVHFKITFYGPRKKNDKFFQEVQKIICKIQNELGQYIQFIDERIGKRIVEDRKIQQKIEQECKISLIVSSSKVDAFLELNLGKKGQIIIVKTNDLEQIPLGSNLFFDNKETVLELKEKYLEKFQINVKRMKQSKWHEENERTRSYTLFFKENFQIIEMLAQSFKIWQTKKNPQSLLIGLILPKINPQIWIKKLLDQLIRDPKLLNIPFSIFILDPHNTETIEKIVDILEYSPFSQREEIEVQWFCQRKPYSKSANMKINDAIANQLSEVMLDKEDVQAVEKTHICDLSKKTIITTTRYGSKNEEIPFTYGSNEITFKYKNYNLKFPQSEYNKVIYHMRVSMQSRFYINLPFYLIDLTQQKQINIFTNFERPISKVENKILRKEHYEGYVKAFYHKSMTELIFNFQENEVKFLQEAVKKMEDYKTSLWIKEEVKIKDIPNLQFKKILKQRIQTRAQQCSLKYELDPYLKNIVVQTCEPKDLKRFKDAIENQVDYILGLSQNKIEKVIDDFKYPPFWEPQKNDIQTFQVSKGSVEFLEVETLFGKPILGLVRIQNKIIYKRFYEELQHLAFLNGKAPLEKKLFHGTHNTPSEVIYEDKEDGFNINYSSDANLLGRGIYFAEKSDYSIYYASREYLPQNIPCKGMLLCSVIVGDSQEMIMSQNNRNVIDTKVKSNGIHYQSMKGKHHICDIYVVYKNRRAYPQYLIKFQ